MSTIILLSTILLSASGNVSDTFALSVTPERLVAWVQQHHSDIVRATGSEVVWNRGRRMCVQRATLRGTIWGVLEGTLTAAEDGGYRYACETAKGELQGGLRDYQLQVTVKPINGKSQVNIQVRAVVDLRVRDYQVQNRMQESLQRVRSLLQSVS